MQRFLRFVFGTLMWISGAFAVLLLILMANSDSLQIKDSKSYFGVAVLLSPPVVFYALYEIASLYAGMRGLGKAVISAIGITCLLAIGWGIFHNWESIWEWIKAIAIGIGIIIFGIAFLLGGGARPDPIPASQTILNEIDDLKNEIKKRL